MPKRRKERSIGKTVAEVSPFAYQPSKAELEADVSVDADPEALAECLGHTVAVDKLED